MRRTSLARHEFPRGLAKPKFGAPIGILKPMNFTDF